jgi:hypothetical protein
MTKLFSFYCTGLYDIGGTFFSMVKKRMSCVVYFEDTQIDPYVCVKIPTYGIVKIRLDMCGYLYGEFDCCSKPSFIAALSIHWNSVKNLWNSYGLVQINSMPDYTNLPCDANLHSCMNRHVST